MTESGVSLTRRGLLVTAGAAGVSVALRRAGAQVGAPGEAPSLVADKNVAGLWTNPRWVPGTPGTFALVIGVSQYCHLLGGAGPLATKVRDLKLGLGQLSVSAVTAHAFFEWVQRAYRKGDAPLAQCWLLLAPVPEERALIGNAISSHSPNPTFETCLDAIGNWYRAMKGLPKPAADRSRSLFFFSGHGLEVIDGYQVLLPSDYLRPTLESVERALSSANLMKGVKALEVDEHFFFLDACRDDVAALLSNKPIKGFEALDEPLVPPGRRLPPKYVQAFYATASGAGAYQVKDRGLSLFGESLLEGLQAQGLQPDCGQQPCSIHVYQLDYFLKARVTGLAACLGGTQRYVLGGDPIDTMAVVTEIDPPPLRTGMKPSRLEQARTVLNEAFTVSDWHDLKNRRGTMMSATGEPFEVDSVEQLFGSRLLGELWKGVRVYDLEERLNLPQGNLEVERVVRSPDGDVVAVEFGVARPMSRLWLTLEEEERGRVHGCTLLTDRDERTHFIMTFYIIDKPPPSREEFDLALPHRNVRGRVNRIELQLSPRNSGLLNRAAEAWLQFEHGDIRRAAQLAGEGLLNFALDVDEKSPVTAVVATEVLARFGQWNQLAKFAKRLTRVFPRLPDAFVLLADYLLDGPDPPLYDEAAAQLLKVDELGMPLTTECLRLAFQKVELVRRAEGLKLDIRARLEKIHSRLIDVLWRYRRGGLFCTFSGDRETIKPELVQGRVMALKNS